MSIFNWFSKKTTTEETDSDFSTTVGGTPYLTYSPIELKFILESVEREIQQATSTARKAVAENNLELYRAQAILLKSASLRIKAIARRTTREDILKITARWKTAYDAANRLMTYVWVIETHEKTFLQMHNTIFNDLTVIEKTAGWD